MLRVAKGANQKLKMLYVRDYLRENSNFEHPVPVAELIDYLKANGIDVERKTVYDDIAQLQLFGEDICLAKGRGGGYYYDSTEFSLPEIKMLVDSVQSSKFITEKQSLDRTEDIKVCLLSREQVLDLMINGAAPEWQNTGVSAVYYREMANRAANAGNRWAISNPQIESNSAVNIWNSYEHEPYMRRRCYIKKLK